MLFTKEWAKCRQLLDASKGLLNSFCIALMVIQYLQARDVLPVLPVAHAAHSHMPSLPVPPTCPSDASNGRVAARVSSGALLLGFFRYFGLQVQPLQVILSVRKGTLQPRGPASVLDPVPFLVLEDPIDPLDNPARGSTRQTWEKVRGECLRAMLLLSSDSLHTTPGAAARPDRSRQEVLTDVQEFLTGDTGAGPVRQEADGADALLDRLCRVLPRTHRHGFQQLFW